MPFSDAEDEEDGDLDGFIDNEDKLYEDDSFYHVINQQRQFEKEEENPPVEVNRGVVYTLSKLRRKKWRNMLSFID